MREYRITRNTMFIFGPRCVMQARSDKRFKARILAFSSEFMRRLTLDTKRILQLFLQLADHPCIELRSAEGESLFSQVLVGTVNMLTTVLALAIIDRVGRKQLVYWGVSGMILSLIGIGVYFLFGTAWGLPNAFLLVFFLFYVFCCAVSICAVVFVLLSEMYPTRVRGIAMSIAGLSLWVGTYLIGQLTPWMLENLTPAGTFFLFAAMCIPYIVIMWRAVPETTGRSLEEIEKYWMN